MKKSRRMYLIGFVLLMAATYVIYIAGVERDSENKSEIIDNDNSNFEALSDGYIEIKNILLEQNISSQKTNKLLKELFGKNYKEIINNSESLNNLKNKLKGKSLEHLVQENMSLKFELENLRLKISNSEISKTLIDYILNYRFKEALTLINSQLINFDENNSDLKKSELYQLQGYVYGGLGENEKREESFRIASFHESQNPFISLEYANVLSYNGKYYLALEQFEKSYKTYKDQNLDDEYYLVKFYRSLSDSYLYLSRFDEAEETIEKALTLNLDETKSLYRYDMVYNIYARVFMKTERLKKSEEMFLKSLKLSEGYENEISKFMMGNTYNSLSILYDIKGDYELAINNNNKALDIYKILYPNGDIMELADAYHNRGAAQLHAGKFNEALEPFIKSKNITISLYGENHPALFITYESLGSVYALKEDYVQSKDYLEKAYALTLKFYGDDISRIQQIKEKLLGVNAMLKND